MIDLSLDRILRLLDRLGNPERRLPPVVHVAGTNGKGSVIALLGAMLEAGGFRVHAYTSPHLVRFSERISLGGRPVAEEELAGILAECERCNGETPITFFEITTVAALLAFSRHPADILLLEVGLGGRLDATNVIEHPLLTAITPLSMDHMAYLGDSLEEIAAEKAGVFKSGVPAVVAPQPPAAMRVIEERARAIGTPLHRHGAEWEMAVASEGWRFRGLDRDLTLPFPVLAGVHQVVNAGVALACLHRMNGFAVDGAAVRRGLAAVDWPGRLQKLHGTRLAALLPQGSELWLDGGHNPAAGEALAATLGPWADQDAARATPRPLHLVVGMLNSKRPADFLAPLAGLAEALVGVDIPDEVASLGAADIVAAARALGLDACPAESVAAALCAIGKTRASGPPPRVLICGSLYLAGKVLASEGDGFLTPRADTTRAPAA